MKSFSQDSFESLGSTMSADSGCVITDLQSVLSLWEETRLTNESEPVV